MSARRFFALAPLQLIQALIGLGSIAAFTRLMSPEQFGEYALALSVSLAGHALAFSWLQAAAFRFLQPARANDKLPEHFATLIATSIAISVCVVALTALLFLLAGLPQHMATLAVFAVGAALMRFFTRIGRESDRAEFAFKRYAVLETLYLTLGFAVGVAALLVFDMGAAAPFVGLLAAGAVVALFDMRRLAHRARGGQASLDRAGDFANYGAPLAAALLIDLAVNAIVRFIIAHQTGTADLGAFAAAQGLARPIDLLFLGLTAAFAPLLVKANSEAGASATRQVSKDMFALLAALAIPAAAGLALVAEPLSAVLVGEELRVQTAQIIPWMALSGLLCAYASYFWAEAFQFSHRTGERALLLIPPSILQLWLTWQLTPTHGAVGAGIAACIASALACVLLASFGRRHLAQPIPYAALARIGAATAFMTIVVLAIPRNAPLLYLLLCASAGVAAYGAAALALNLFDARARATHAARTLWTNLASSSSAA